MNLEQRLRALEDRAAIQDLIVAYCLSADTDDLNGVGACFTPDATFSSSGVLNASTAEEIVSFIAAARSQMGLTLHTPDYVQITFDGPDSASGIVGAHFELVLAGESMYGALRYVDRYARVGDKWLISKRDMKTIFMAKWSDVSEAFASTRPVRWPGVAPAKSDCPRKDGQS